MVLNWNGWEDTLACLASLRAAEEVGTVWLIDNGSTEDRSAEAEVAYPGLRVVRLGHNYGWAGGYNRALALAREQGYPYAYLLNNDARVDPGFLASCLVEMGRGARVAAVGSCILRLEDGSVWFDGHYGYAPGERKAAALDGRPATVVEEVNGCGMLVALDAVAACGPFDERYFCYREEAEWSRRIRRHGWTLRVAPASRVRHALGGSDRNANTAYYMNRNLVLDAEEASGWARVGRRWGAFYFMYRSANEARRRGDRAGEEACLQALRDGWKGRFGPRPAAGRAPLLLRLAARTWPFPQGAFRRWWGRRGRVRKAA